MSNLHQLLSLMVEKGASDLHLTCGSPPQLRIDGLLVPVKSQPLTSQDTQSLCYSFLTEEQRAHFEDKKELDLSFGVRGLCRFRVNLFVQRGAISGAFRAVANEILNFETLGLPPVVSELTKRSRGLILVTGATGSGKSTTLAAMIDKINRERNQHIVTIEDPIEYLHVHRKCVVSQREVGSDTHAFSDALRHVLRQDPDVVLIGEMRDLETVRAALTVSETGHLVMSTLHTNSALQSINRIVDLFPPHQQSQIRSQLSFSLEAVISQQLLLRSSGAGRVLASEVMIATPGIRNLIREDKVHQIYSQMQVGQSRYGMQTMNQSLLSLINSGQLSIDDALRHSNDMEELNQMITAAR